MMNILKKYSVQKVEVAVETEDKEEKEEAKGNQM
jgi:hypothetical protein